MGYLKGGYMEDYFKKEETKLERRGCSKKGMVQTPFRTVVCMSFCMSVYLYDSLPALTAPRNLQIFGMKIGGNFSIKLSESDFAPKPSFPKN